MLEGEVLGRSAYQQENKDLSCKDGSKGCFGGATYTLGARTF